MLVVGGVFVGGAARRMGGAAKGLLRAPSGDAIAARLAKVLDELGVGVVLVGDARAYAELGRGAIPDAFAGIGPLGGLVALLRHARALGAAHALALACDMPFVSRALVARLVGHASDAAIVAPRRDGRWEPLFARFDVARALPIAEGRAVRGEGSLQRLFDEAGAAELPVDAREADELRDWDTPDDVAGA